MSLSFAFDWPSPPPGRLTGFSLGHLTVTGDDGSVTSAGRTPDQSMMLPLAVTDLLDGLRALIAGPEDRRYEFVGADSSFRLAFIRSGGHIRVVGDGGIVASVPVPTFAAVCARDIGGFARQLLDILPVEDPVFGDLIEARVDFLDAINT